MGDSGLIERFRSIREKVSLSQKDFAQTLGVSQSSIADIERGAKEPSRNIMLALVEQYHISLDWLLLGIGTAPIEPLVSVEEFAALKKEISDLEGKIRELEAENKEITQELLDRMRQLVDVQSRQLGVV